MPALKTALAFVLTLGELGRFAGLLEAVLAALFHPRVPGQETGPLQ